MSGREGEGTTLEYTPTWVVAAVCTVIVAISLVVERFLHHLGRFLKRRNQKPLFEALQKVKEELMLMGFMSLLLTGFQGAISKMCMKEDFMKNMLPCELKRGEERSGDHNSMTTEHFRKLSAFPVVGMTMRLLAEQTASQVGYCAQKHKVPLLSAEALFSVDLFISVLAMVHVSFCALTFGFGRARIRQWKKWEDSIARDNYNLEYALKNRIASLHQHAFIKEHFLGFGKDSAILGWVYSFFKQFYGSLRKTDYMTLRLGFVMTHCRANLEFNFHNYVVRAFEDDFKKVVGISWYLWVFVVIFLLLNVNGWHTYFWLAFIPFILLLAVGTKLEHVISQLAHEVAEKHVAIEGELVVQPSDEHFWFKRPRFVLFLIHFILFQNSFEIAFFFWILVQYGFDSCIMGQALYIVPRLIIGVFIQVLCSYSTLPLYAIVTQMGSSFKKAIFDKHVQVGVLRWAQKVKKKRGIRAAAAAATATDGSASTTGIELATGVRSNGVADEEIRPSGESK